MTRSAERKSAEQSRTPRCVWAASEEAVDRVHHFLLHLRMLLSSKMEETLMDNEDKQLYISTSLLSDADPVTNSVERKIGSEEEGIP